MLMTGNVVREGVDLIERWERAVEQVADCKQALNRAECEALNAESALAKWLMPADAEPREKFSVWHGRDLIEVTAPYEVGSRFVDATVTKRQRAAGK